jgi:hypothetical protein
MFRALCHALEVMPKIFEVVSFFGVKTSDVDEYMTVFHRRHLKTPDNNNVKIVSRSGNNILQNISTWSNQCRNLLQHTLCPKTRKGYLERPLVISSGRDPFQLRLRNQKIYVDLSELAKSARR